MLAKCVGLLAVYCGKHKKYHWSRDAAGVPK
jgi:hypothetical protein